MRKIFILTIFSIFLFVNFAQAMSTEDYVSALEQKLFGMNYPTESLDERVDRIEMQIYNNSYNGSAQERLIKIDKIYPKDELYNSSQNPINQPQQYQASDNWYSEDYPTSNEPAAYNNYPIISEIEESMYQKNYQGEDIYKRLGRLEKELYGNVKSEQSLHERVDNLRHILPKKHYNKYTAQNMGFENFGLKQPVDYVTPNSYNPELIVKELELETFNRSYEHESPSKRIERLENYYFGSISMGQSDEDRVNRLASVIMNTKNMEDYFPQPKGAQWAGILMNLLVFGLGFLL